MAIEAILQELSDSVLILDGIDYEQDIMNMQLRLVAMIYILDTFDLLKYVVQEDVYNASKDHLKTIKEKMHDLDIGTDTLFYSMMGLVSVKLLERKYRASSTAGYYYPAGYYYRDYDYDRDDSGGGDGGCSSC